MIVKMLTCECGPNGSFAIGEHRTVTDDIGQMLIVTGHAELVKRETAVAPMAEVAVVTPVEVAAPPTPEAHGKRRK